jgi:sugar transferase (PEP-CTERM/EpsH1 system associated)
MAEIIFLSQRIPYPPHKGDKIRSFNLLRGLARTHTVRVGSFVDDPGDWAHVEELKSHCAEVFLLPLNRRSATLRSLRGLLTGDPLSKPFYFDSRMAEWVAQSTRAHQTQVAFIFSSAMAQYVLKLPERPPHVVMDFVDVDSEKWRHYAERRSGPMRWLYRREGRTLLAHDTAIARMADASLFVSEREAALFQSLAPAVADKVSALQNGVDTGYFDPAACIAAADDRPSDPAKLSIVFTGAMDYEPNIDAVTWFADHVLEDLRRRRAGATFRIVGTSPSREVQALATRPGIEVTGRVPDVRPYILQADVVVAPLEIARGVQNKVLEAMAMARPVVVTPQALEGLNAAPGQDVLCAERSAAPFLAAVLSATEPDTAKRLGLAARRYAVDNHSWDASSAALDRLLKPAFNRLNDR